MRQRNNVVIELTPLLDVILIILFMIISQNSADAEKVKADAETAVAEYSARLEETEKQLNQAESLVAGFDSFNEQAVIITVGLYIGKSADEKRTLSVTVTENGETGETKEIEYGWSNLRYGQNSLRSALEERIPPPEENRPVLISFAYSEEYIYMQDYRLVTDVLDGMRGENVYITYKEI